MRTAAPMKNHLSANSGSALRYGMFICVDPMLYTAHFHINLAGESIRDRH